MTTIPGLGPAQSIASISSPNWLAEAHVAIQSSATSGGLIAALNNSKNPNGSLKGFLANSISASNSFAAITHGNADDRASLTMRIATAAYQRALQERAELELQLNAENTFQPPQLLDTFIHFDNGSVLDTENNILTRSDGTKIDVTTGQEYVDESAIIRFPNGSYLDTKNNILTLANGTKIDVVTHLVIST